MRDLLALPFGQHKATTKAELARLLKLRRAMIQAGWFN